MVTQHTGTLSGSRQVHVVFVVISVNLPGTKLVFVPANRHVNALFVDHCSNEGNLDAATWIMGLCLDVLPWSRSLHGTDVL